MRHLILALFILVPLSAPAQDEAKIRDLIQKLDDDSFETREQAEKDLVAIGEPAAPFLKKAAEEAEQRKERGELKVRAVSALRAIELAVKAKKVYSEPALVTLQLKDSYLTRALEDLTRQTGVKFNASDVDPRGAVTIDVKDAPLFKVLDDLCRGQEERTYEWRDETVKFLKERHLPYPAAYQGPFRIRIVRMKQERSTDFKARTSQVQLSLDADWQKYLTPAKRYEIELKKAVDDKQVALEVRKGEDFDDANFGMAAGAARLAIRRAFVVAGGAGGDAPGQPQAFTLKGLGAGATRLTIEGVARFSFPLEKTDVVFEKPGASETREAGDYTIALRNIASGRLWSLAFSRTKGKPDGGSAEDVDGRLDKESLVAIDDDGNEQRANLIPTHATGVSVVVGGGAPTPVDQPLATYQIMFAGARLKTVKEIRFKFVGQAFVKTVPFKFENVELP